MKERTKFYCTECGNEVNKWSGQCPFCHRWNTLVEAPTETASTSGKSRSGAAKASSRASGLVGGNKPQKLDEIDMQEEVRFSTHIGELDRVLGGGAVRGSLVLVGGAPGVGKSTLLLQICGLLPQEKVLYISGEESQRQLKMRAQRLGVQSKGLYVLAETRLAHIIDAIEELSPDIVIIDSVQTIYNNDLTAGPGSVSQVKDCSMAIMQVAKANNFTCFLVGHVNKEGAIAGPKVLEHMVDCVLYFEGDRAMAYRIIRAAKNRFGSTNEIGVFEMIDNGLEEVPNPSEAMLSGRPMFSPGTCVTCVMEGTRPILAEVQSLVAPANFGSAIRRTINGVEYNRAMMLLAVLEKRGSMQVLGCDAFINVIGGLEIDEPAADLAILLALASSARDRMIDYTTVAIGEVGLTGEVRSVSSINQRLSESARLGFKRCVIPAHTRGEIVKPKDMEVVRVSNIQEALKAVLMSG